MDVLKLIASKLGVIRNQLLVFTLLGAFLIFFYARDLIAAESPEVQAHGVRMFWIAVALIVFGALFYVLAYFKLPSSTQEVIFERDGRDLIREHRARANPE
jgi:TRAP-type C4-dicarboxylate transport system permease small subunit